MDKSNPKIAKIIERKGLYMTIQDSKVSWRRKSSYRKPIKRWVSKLQRRGSKKLVKQLADDINYN